MTFFYDLNKRLAAVGTQSTNTQLNERDMSRAAKGYEKYGKEGMEALAKAGREGKDLDPVRAKYDKYDDSVEEGLGDMARKVGGAVKKVASKAMDTVGHGSDADMIRDLQRKMGVPQTGMKPGDEPNPKQIKEKMSPAKAKSFAALAEPKDKITFADKIAGAKKEVDEMLGDVAAEAMKNALGGNPTRKSGTVTKTSTGIKHKAAPGVYGGSDEEEDPLDKLKGPGQSRMRKSRPEVDESDDDNNPFTSWKKPRGEKPKVGSTERGALHDIEHTATGRKVTRRVDQNTGYSVGSDDDKPADGEKRGRGRPKSAPKGPERVTAKATKHKGGRKTTEDYGPMEGEHEGNDELKAAMAMLKKAGYKISKGEQELDEKAVSKKQQKFMGMVHATQKGEKPASGAVAKVAKTMKKGDAEDFASTKHKGLPEKKKSEGKKEKTEETTDSTPSKGGMKFGGGIYDSMNRDLENMIAESMSQLTESMSVNMSDSTEGGQSLTITASDEDALKLATLLKSAGLGGGDNEGYGGGGYKSACGCGTPDCSCGDEGMDEAAPAVSDNEPNWPTNTETNDDALQYAGGLNKPKSTGQSTVPVLASQDDRQHSYAEAEEDALHRMMEMAGVKKKEVDEEKTEEGNLFTGNLAKARAAGKEEADLDGDGDMEKVDEGILASTANLWKAYKGQYGV